METLYSSTIFFLVLFNSVIAKAQKHEVYLSYGVGSAQEIVEDLGEIGTSIVTGGLANSTTSINYGPIIIGYNHYFNPKWSAGALYSNTSLDGSFTESISGSAAYYTNTYNVVMLRTDYRYVNNSKLQLYSGIAAGLSFAHSEPNKGSTGENSSATDFAFQLNALGLRYGTGWGIFGEIGFGYNGVINVGVSKRF